MRAVLALVILLFLLGHTLAVAPGDEDDECAVQNYTSKTRVLLDSWRYQTLLADDTTMSVWTTYNNDSNENGVWSSVGGTCEDGVVAVCPGNITKVLETQVIKKSLPAPDEYPVTVFVEISYSISCPNGSDCSFELQLFHFVGMNQDSVALQDNQLPNIPIYKIQFTASPNNFYQFKLSIVAHPSSSGCISVKRVLVFLNECPSQQSNGGLGLLPATQAPYTVSNSVYVTPQCVENSALSLMSAKGVQCTSDGTWVNDETLCVCNEGYYNDNGVCRAVMVYYVSEDKGKVEVCFIQEIVTNLTFEITTRDVTAINNFDYLHVPLNLTTVPGSQCTSVLIIPDGLSEGEESFDVVVMRVDNNMILSYATVYITGSGSSCTEGSVGVVSNAFNNDHQLVEMCTSEGVWSSVCDIEWTEQDATVVCRELGYSSLVSQSVLDSERSTNMIVNCNGTENNLKSCFSQITHTTPCGHLLVYCKDPLPTVFTSGGQIHTLIITASNKPHQTPIITASNTPHKTPIITASNTTPIITASNTPHLNNTAENDDDGGIPIAAIAGLCVAIVISIIIILIVILLIVLLSKKSNRKLQSKKPSETAESETCKDLSNPVYDSTTQGNICRSGTTEASNRQETASSPTLHNPLYTLPVHPTDNTSSGQPLNGYYEDPEYSVPKVGYETPVNTPSPQPPIRHVYDYAALDTSPTESPSPQPPTHMYDYAVIPPSTHALVPPTTAPEYAVVPPTTAPEYAVVPPTTAPDYAILESNEHTYHYLESNELSSQQQQQEGKGLQSGSRDIYHSQGHDAEYSKLVHK